MICSKCGLQVDASNAFCPNCGKAVAKAPEPAPPNNPDGGFRSPVAYDITAFEIAKEYISTVRSARGMSVAALALILSVVPAGLLLILIPFSVLLLAGMGLAAFICAMVSGSKLGRAKKLPIINPGSIDPVSFATYQKALKDAKSAKTMNTAAIVLSAVAVMAIILIIAAFVLLGAGVMDMVDGSSSFSGPAYYY